MRVTAVALAVCLLALLTGCSEHSGISGLPGGWHPPGDDGNVEITHVNYGCGGDSIFPISQDCEAAQLTGFTKVSDTVTLTIAFSANCCPKFGTTASVEGNAITIAVVDTLYGCKCICGFENDFIFDWPAADSLFITFDAREISSPGYCTSSLDTVIVFTEGPAPVSR